VDQVIALLAKESCQVSNGAHRPPIEIERIYWDTKLLKGYRKRTVAAQNSNLNLETALIEPLDELERHQLGACRFVRG